MCLKRSLTFGLAFAGFTSTMFAKHFYRSSLRLTVTTASFNREFCHPVLHARYSMHSQPPPHNRRMKLLPVLRDRFQWRFQGTTNSSFSAPLPRCHSLHSTTLVIVGLFSVPASALNTYNHSLVEYSKAYFVLLHIILI